MSGAHALLHEHAATLHAVRGEDSYKLSRVRRSGHGRSLGCTLPHSSLPAKFLATTLFLLQVYLYMYVEYHETAGGGKFVISVCSDP